MTTEHIDENYSSNKNVAVINTVTKTGAKAVTGQGAAK